MHCAIHSESTGSKSKVKSFPKPQEPIRWCWSPFP